MKYSAAHIVYSVEKMQEDGLKYIQFNLNINPAHLPTAQEKGVRIIKVHGKMLPMFYEKKNVKDAHTLLKYSMEKHKPKEPMHGPIALSVEYLFPYPKGTPKCRQVEGTPMVQRPDVDNIQKLLQDVMTEMGFWDDDSQIWKLTLVKRRTVIEPMIKVSIWQTGEADGKRTEEAREANDAWDSTHFRKCNQ